MTLQDDDLVLYHYGEADDPVAVERALAASARDRERLERLRQVLAAVEVPPLPELPASYTARLWARLESELAPPSRRRGLASWVPAWWGIAAVVLLAAGFLAGRLGFGPTPPSPPGAEAALPAAARARILEAALAEHLERAHLLLLDLEHAGERGVGGLASERERARDLTGATRLYRVAAERGGDPRSARFLDELERFLMEVAHSDSSPQPDARVHLRQRLEAVDLLFKLRVVGGRLRDRVPTKAGRPAA